MLVEALRINTTYENLKARNLIFLGIILYFIFSAVEISFSVDLSMKSFITSIYFE